VSESIYDGYALDTQAENEGQWVDFRGKVQIQLRSDNSLQARKWSNRRIKQQRQQLIAHGGVLPPEVLDKNEIDLCAEVLVLSWRNVLDRDGKPIPCTPDNARKLLTELPSLRRDVLFAARSEETFRPDVEALGKTSATPSVPSSSSADVPSKS
jgi:hypothetical protein